MLTVLTNVMHEFHPNIIWEDDLTLSQVLETIEEEIGLEMMRWYKCCPHVNTFYN